MTTNGTHHTNGTNGTNGESSKDKAINGHVNFQEESKLISLDNLAEVVGDIESGQMDHVQSQNKGKVKNLTAPGESTLDDIVLQRNEIDLDLLKKKIFQDHRWDNAMSCLEDFESWDRSIAYSVLREGAKTFGCWHLDELDLAGLANQLMKTRDKKCSPALKRWIYVNDQMISDDLHELNVEQELNERTPMTVTPVAPAPKGKKLCMKHTLDERQVVAFMAKSKKEKERFSSIKEWRSSVANADHVKVLKWSLSFIIFVCSTAYAIKVVTQMYPRAIAVLGWPVFFARMGGMGAACWTCVIYFTMCRGLITQLVTWKIKCGCSSKLYQAFFDGHKDLHILAGKALVMTGIEHTIAHCIGTIPGILASTEEEINDLIGCANPDTPGNFGVKHHHIQWPKCPIEQKPRDFTEALFTTMPGLTGLILLVLIAGLSYTARAAGRTNKFERFWYFHNFLLVTWPITLFIHGSNNWIGVGFPLVVFTSSFPVACYLVDRILRALRYFLFAGKSVKILDIVLRPGKDDGPEGAMTYVQIAKPPALWKFRPGQYAFICMPEYSMFQWHPFTICSGKKDPTVDFLIAGVGDWTKELARRCLASRNTGAPLPKVALDGPYAAPTQSALSRDVLVSVGAGVGITPFLSLMSTIIQMVENDKENKLPLKEAHFYWSTRSADEFLFGRDAFTHIAQSELLRKKVFLHLHVTARDKPKDPHSFIFREAIKRQSAVDRRYFNEFQGRFHSRGMMPDGICTPTAWMNGSYQDVLWLGHLTEQYDESEECEDSEKAVATSYSGHWAQNAVLRKKNTGPVQEEQPNFGILSSFFPTQMTAPKHNPLASGSLINPEYAERATKEPSHMDWMVPVVFGRPEFAIEVRMIGKAFPQCDVDVYICGNDAIVHNLQEVAIVCAEHAKRDYEDGSASRIQQYNVHYERFG